MAFPTPGIDPKEIIQEFLVARLTDPKGRLSTKSEEFTGDGTTTTFTLTPTSGRTFRAVTSVQSSIQSREYLSDSDTVGLWHINESSGINVADSSSKNFDATATGTTIVDGKFGKARTISIVTDKIQKSDEPELRLDSHPWTVEGWFKTSNTTDPQDLTSKITNSIGWIIRIQANGTMNADFTTGLTPQVHNYTPPSEIRDGAYHHYAWTYDGSTMKGYLDGIERLSTATTGTVSIDVTAPFNIGGISTGDTEFFRGDLDEVRISDIVRRGFDVRKKWEDYDVDLKNKQIIFKTAPINNEIVTINYKEGATNWIFLDLPREDLGTQSFPRMRILLVSQPDFRVGAFNSSLHSTLHVQVDIWTRSRNPFTISGRSYNDIDLAYFLANQARLAFKNNEDDVYPRLHSYRSIAFREMGYDNTHSAYHGILEFNLQGIDVGE